MEPRVCLGTPIYGRPHWLYNEDVNKLMLSRTVAMYVPLAGYLVHIARNMIVEMALHNGDTHIWFIDADQFGFDAEMLRGLLAHDVDVVAPLTFRRHQGHEPVIYRIDERGKLVSMMDYPRKSFFEVEGVGMGCCLIKTTVFEKMNWPWFYHSFSIDRNWIGEDDTFCNMARAAGFKIYADTNYCVSHIAEWPMNENTWDLIGRMRRYQSERAEARKGN